MEARQPSKARQSKLAPILLSRVIPSEVEGPAAFYAVPRLTRSPVTEALPVRSNSNSSPSSHRSLRPSCRLLLQARPELRDTRSCHTASQSRPSCRHRSRTGGPFKPAFGLSGAVLHVDKLFPPLVPSIPTRMLRSISFARNTPHRQSNPAIESVETKHLRLDGPGQRECHAGAGRETARV
jgi:hypothetical protein